jgi:hypothetical protein
MQTGRAASFLSLALLWGPGAWAARQSVLYPSDLGPAKVDVSGYPMQMQRIYRELLPGKCMACHSLARALNSPIAELSAEEEAAERAAHPELFQEGILKAGPESWSIYIKRMFMRPPCCGSCGVWTREDIRQVHRFLKYDSLRRKTGAAAPAWIALRKGLLADFKKLQESPPKEVP